VNKYVEEQKINAPPFEYNLEFVEIASQRAAEIKEGKG